MSDINELAGRYIDAWNERDAAVRKAAVAVLWTEDGRYVDPLADVSGHDGIDAIIGAVQAQFPDFAFRLGTPADAHHDVARFTWELGPAGGEAVVGFDVIVFAEDGRIRNVHGFLDKIPAQ